MGGNTISDTTNKVSSLRDNKGNNNIMAVDGINGLLWACNNNNNRSVRTPTTVTTEASSPESKSYENNNDDDDLSVCGDQRHLSQTDHHIRSLDQDGSLNEVAGSQSMLSQELVIETGAGYLSDIELSQETQPESSIGMAKRLGLLSQTQEEEEEEEHQEVDQLETTIESLPLTGGGAKQFQESNQQHDDTPPKISEKVDIPTEAKKSPIDDASISRESPKQEMTEKVQLSGLELLTQVGSNEADKLTSTRASNSSPIGGGGYTGIIQANASTSTDAQIRESEGFGSLLDAVAKITEQEETVEGSGGMPVLWQSSSSSDNPLHLFSNVPAIAESTTSTKRDPSTRKRTNTPKIANPQLSIKAYASKKRKTETQKEKEKLRREKQENENKKAQAIAKKAAMIAERTIADPSIAKKLLLSMALKRENPRSKPENLPGKGHVIQEGFFWAHYPPLETVLKKNMAEYYELSTKKCQSAQQQAFNNYMVLVVRGVAEARKWKFANMFEEDKSLRDRIRCYYKTHIQNAKKRLKTMLSHPTKRANARHLCEHLDLIEQHSVQEEKEEELESNSKQKHRRDNSNPKTTTPESSQEQQHFEASPETPEKEI